MYKKIMVPVDLEHTDKLEKALATAADIARNYGIPLVYVSVTSETPSAVASNPKEFSEKLEAFGVAQASARGVEVSSLAISSHDPATDLGAKLLDAIDKSGADLVVMASHLPGIPEHIFSSNAGHLASHAKVSVLVVR